MSDSGFDDLDELTEVNVETIRQALDDVDAQKLSESTITLAIKLATTEVKQRASPDVSESTKLAAVVKVAAYHAFDSSPSTVQKEAADASKRWDTEGFLERLERRAEEAKDDVARSNRVMLRTLGGRSRDTRGRLRGPRYR